MMIRILMIGLVFCVIWGNSFAESSVKNVSSFIHPGLSHSEGDLEFIKAKVNAKEEPWNSAFNAMKNSNYARLSWTPKPREIVACGFYNNPNQGCHEQTDDALAAYTHALMWYLTEDQRYADKSIQILNKWVQIHKNNTDKNSPLQVGWAAPGFIDAAEILRYSNAGWSEEEITAFSNYIRAVYLPIIRNNNPYNPNWMFSILQARLSIAVFTNDMTLFNASKAKWNERIVNMIYQSTDGAKPVRIGNDNDANMDRNWYGSWYRNRWFDGFSQETCRDLEHMFLGSKSMSYSGQILYTQGIDVFDTHKERIQDFVEFHCGIYNGNPYGNEICGGPINFNGSSTYRSGRVSNTHMELLYYHLHDRLGMDVPEAEKLVLRSRPRKAQRWFSKWETLTYANLQCSCVPPPKIQIISPNQNSNYTIGDTVFIEVDVIFEEEVIIKNVEFKVGDQVLESQNIAPYTMVFVPDDLGVFKVLITVYYNESKAVSEEVFVHVAEEKAPYLGEAILLPGILQAEHYDLGGEGVSYHDSERENLGYNTKGVGFRVNDGVDVDKHPKDGYIVSWNETGEWLEYTVDVETSGIYNLRFYYSAELNSSLAVSIDGDTVLSSVGIPSTRSATAFFSASKELSLNAGEQVWRIITESGAYNLDRMKITLEHATSTNSLKLGKPALKPNTADYRSLSLSHHVPWKVYTTLGVKVKSGVGNAIELNELLRGIYIVSYPYQSQKIIVR